MIKQEIETEASASARLILATGLKSNGVSAYESRNTVGFGRMN